MIKIKADYANAPQWRMLTVKATLPDELKCLGEIAHNMWWVWNAEARDLFRDLDEQIYHEVRHNPVMLLERLTFARKEAILKDKALMKRVKEVSTKFREYMDVKPDKSRPSVAYFCMEYGIHSALKIYSGGLGMLAGDYVKEASDSNVDMCAVGFLYRFGYFTQSLSIDGQQIANYEAQNFGSLPIVRQLDENGKPVPTERWTPKVTGLRARACHTCRYERMGEDNKIVNITNSDILTTAYGMYSLTASDIKKYGQSVEYANSLVAQGAPVKMLRITPPDSTYALSTILIQWKRYHNSKISIISLCFSGLCFICEP